MDDAGVVGRLEGLADLDGDVDGFAPGDAFVTVEPLGECFAFDVLHDVVVGLVRSTMLEEPDDVWAFEFLERLDLAVEPGEKAGFAGEGRREHLDGDLISGLLVSGEIDGSHTAGPEDLVDEVGANPFWNLVRHRADPGLE